MSVTYTYTAGTYNVGQLSNEMVAAGVDLITIRGTGTADVDVVCGNGQAEAAVTTVAGAHTAVFPTFSDSTHKHAGTDITSGTIVATRLGSGSPSSGNFLRGDSSWQVP